ncbi:MAG: oxygenase MpaB family protein, partial [Vicinamibacterales bacterium]
QRHRAAVRARLLRSDQVRPGPDSVSWKVNREMVVVAGWGRAILLQLAHPAVAAGVHGHSTFRGSLRSSFRRLHSTVGSMLSLTFGDTEQMITAAARINAIHDRVKGTVARERSGGAAVETYSAHDPDLQRWVHATLLDSIPRIYERLVGHLTVDERDRYCAEAAMMEPLLGMPPGRLPRDVAQLDAYMRETLAGGTLVVTDTSRALARALLYPPRWHAVWPAFRAMQLITIGSLPRSMREAYGFEWQPSDERALARWTMMLRISVRLLPRLALEWPMARHCAGSTNADPVAVMQPRNGEQAPVVILARNLIDDISDLCVRMAIINHHELRPAEPTDRPDEQGRWQGSDL